MTTSEPALAIEIFEAGKDKGVCVMDAPVSGGDIGAREARLSIMAGGEESTFASLTPLFNLMGKNVRYMGPAGRGQHTKVVNQILIATTMVGVCEGLLYAHRVGLDPMNVIAAVGAGAAGSFSVNQLGPRIVNNNFEPGFYVEHFCKDLYIALQEARRMKLSLPGLALAQQMYQALEAQGFGRKGTQALYLALESLNGVKRE
jgi:3-hydroxyisobutyrate dehydrogenase